MNLKFPAGQSVAVVGEGDFEPRCIGSYSVRIYSGSNPDFPFDEYITGIIRPRDGFIEDVTFYDLDGDGMAEILVIIRSAGSGGYLSADTPCFMAFYLPRTAELRSSVQTKRQFTLTTYRSCSF